MITLVSAFIDRSAYDPIPTLRPLEFYLEHCKRFLALDVPKVIFLEPHVSALLQPAIDTSTNTVIIPFAKEQMEFWTYREQMLACPRPLGVSHTKDTHDFFIIILNKVAWCTEAARLNPFSTSLFCWVDFGINYILHSVPLSEAVTHLKDSCVSPGTIRLPGCTFYPPHVPNQLVWMYCGGIFCGDAATLQRMQADQRTVVLALLKAGYVTWEVTVWYHMNAPYLDRYVANHDITMFNLF